MADSAVPRAPITVVIPVRNSPRQLRLCLEALLRNSLEQVEILVIDDASTDDTPDVAASFADASGGRLRCARLARQSGPAGARNEGMRQARHPYLFFLDADIVLPPRAVDCVRETLQGHSLRPEVIGVMGVYSETIPWPEFCSNFKNMHICYLHKTTPTVSPYLHTPILCMRKEILEQAGGFDSRLATAEDFRLGLQLGSQGYRFIVDRRIEGVHLKRLTFSALLREDSRRIRDLLSIQLDKNRRKQAYRAHRWSRLISVAIPFPALAATAAVLVWPFLLPVAAACWAAFCGSNFDFLRYVIGRKGLWFGLRSAGFLYVEMLWAQFALAYFVFRKLGAR